DLLRGAEREDPTLEAEALRQRAHRLLAAACQDRPQAPPDRFHGDQLAGVTVRPVEEEGGGGIHDGHMMRLSARGVDRRASRRTAAPPGPEWNRKSNQGFIRVPVPRGPPRG